MINWADLLFRDSFFFFYAFWKKSWHLFHMHTQSRGRKTWARRQSSHQPASSALCMRLRVSPFERGRVHRLVCSLTHTASDRGVTQRHLSLARPLALNSFTPVKKHRAYLPGPLIQPTPPTSFITPPHHHHHLRQHFPLPSTELLPPFLSGVGGMGVVVVVERVLSASWNNTPVLPTAEEGGCFEGCGDGGYVWSQTKSLLGLAVSFRASQHTIFTPQLCK